MRECLNHGLSNTFIMGMFYSRVNPTTKMLVSASSGRALLVKTSTEEKVFIEALA